MKSYKDAMDSDEGKYGLFRTVPQAQWVQECIGDLLSNTMPKRGFPYHLFTISIIDIENIMPLGPS